MSAERLSVWDVLAEPFPPEAVKERQGPKQHDGMCEKRYGQCAKPHKMLSYVDARDVEARLDDAVTPAGWDFMATIAQGNVVHGTLVLFIGDRAVTRQDYGYPNGDDDAEPLKSAVSDAIKRCAVQFGIGRHLYTDNKVTRRPASQPSVPAARQPAQNAPQRPAPRPVAPTPVQARTEPPRAATAPVQNLQPLTMREAMEALEGIEKKAIGDAGKALFGTWSLKEMTPEQRAQLVAHLRGGRGPAVPAESSPADPGDLWEGMPAA